MRKIKKLLKLLLHEIYRHALKYKVAAAIEHEFLLKKIDCKTIVDIGANRGQFALVGRRLFPFAKIISFEPLPEAAKIYRAIFVDDSNTMLRESAIGSTKGSFNIHISNREDSSSMLAISDLQVKLHPDTYEKVPFPIHVGLLEDFIKPEMIISPALLKLDVQGYELEALKGCESLLNKFDYIYAESAFIELYENQALLEDLVLFLKNKGFKLRSIYNLSYHDGFAVDGDFFWVRVCI